jgi:hypothetical protein
MPDKGITLAQILLQNISTNFLSNNSEDIVGYISDNDHKTDLNSNIL